MWLPVTSTLGLCMIEHLHMTAASATVSSLSELNTSCCGNRYVSRVSCAQHTCIVNAVNFSIAMAIIPVNHTAICIFFGGSLNKWCQARQRKNCRRTGVKESSWATRASLVPKAMTNRRVGEEGRKVLGQDCTNVTCSCNALSAIARIDTVSDTQVPTIALKC